MTQLKNNPTLKNNFNEFLKNIITPLLKEHGFKKKGNNYIYSGNKIDYIIHIQLSRWNDATNVVFTFNWGLEFPGQFNSWLRHKRLPSLYTGKDQWWKLTTDKPFLDQEEIDCIKDLLVNGGIKFFNYIKSIDDVIDFLNHAENKKQYKGFDTDIITPQIDLLKEKLLQIKE